MKNKDEKGLKGNFDKFFESISQISQTGDQDKKIIKNIQEKYKINKKEITEETEIDFGPPLRDISKVFRFTREELLFFEELKDILNQLNKKNRPKINFVTLVRGLAIEKGEEYMEEIKKQLKE